MTSDMNVPSGVNQKCELDGGSGCQDLQKAAAADCNGNGNGTGKEEGDGSYVFVSRDGDVVDDDTPSQTTDLNAMSQSLDHNATSCDSENGEQERGSAAVVESELRETPDQVGVQDELHSTKDAAQVSPLDHLAEGVGREPESSDVDGREANVADAGETHGSHAEASELDPANHGGEKVEGEGLMDSSANTAENQACLVKIANGVQGELDSDQGKEPSELINAATVQDSQDIQNWESSPCQGEKNENGDADGLPVVNAQDSVTEFAKSVDASHSVTEFDMELVDVPQVMHRDDEQESCPEEVNNLSSIAPETGMAVTQVPPTNHGQEDVFVNGCAHVSQSQSVVEAESSESKQLDMDGIVEKQVMNGTETVGSHTLAVEMENVLLEPEGTVVTVSCDDGDGESEVSTEVAQCALEKLEAETKNTENSADCVQTYERNTLTSSGSNAEDVVPTNAVVEPQISTGVAECAGVSDRESVHIGVAEGSQDGESLTIDSTENILHSSSLDVGVGSAQGKVVTVPSGEGDGESEVSTGVVLRTPENLETATKNTESSLGSLQKYEENTSTSSGCDAEDVVPTNADVESQISTGVTKCAGVSDSESVVLIGVAEGNRDGETQTCDSAENKLHSGTHNAGGGSAQGKTVTVPSGDGDGESELLAGVVQCPPEKLETETKNTDNRPGSVQKYEDNASTSSGFIAKQVLPTYGDVEYQISTGLADCVGVSDTESEVLMGVAECNQDGETQTCDSAENDLHSSSLDGGIDSVEGKLVTVVSGDGDGDSEVSAGVVQCALDKVETETKCSEDSAVSVQTCEEKAPTLSSGNAKDAAAMNADERPQISVAVAECVGVADRKSEDLVGVAEGNRDGETQTCDSAENSVHSSSLDAEVDSRVEKITSSSTVSNTIRTKELNASVGSDETGEGMEGKCAGVADRESVEEVAEGNGNGEYPTHDSTESNSTEENSFPTDSLDVGVDTGVTEMSKSSSIVSYNINCAPESKELNASIGSDETCQGVEGTSGVFKDHNSASTSDVTKHESAAQGTPVEVGKRPFYWMIKIPRYDDRYIKEEINRAQFQVDEKTKIRDDILAEVRLKKAQCQKYENDFKTAMSEVKSARKLLKDKKKEIDSLQNAIGVEEIDSRIRYLKHMIEHETLSLKEENQLIREFNQLSKQNRENISSNMVGSQDKVQKDQVEERLKFLRKEVDVLREKLLRAEAIFQNAEKKRNEKNDEKNKLKIQFDAANDERQEAYACLQSLKEQLFEKRKNFWRYQDDAKAAFDLAQKGEREKLHNHCSNQVEKVMELWNSSDEFRKQYLRSNMRSTVRRLLTLDGRSLGPDEEPPVIPNVFIPPVTTKKNIVRSPSTLKEEIMVASEEIAKLHNNSTAKVGEQENQNKLSKSTKAVKSAPEVNDSARVSGREEIEEIGQEEQERKKEEEELARKAEELRKEKEAARLKEQHRLEEKAKAKEAMERKKRNAEKAEARAARRAQKEAEQKEKEREKRARKKEKRKTGGEETDGINEIECGPGSETPTEIKDSEKEEKPVTVTKRTQKPSQFTKQSMAKSMLLPLPLRNRSKRRMQSWMWVLLAVLVVFALFVMGNNSFFSSIIGLQRFIF